MKVNFSAGLIFMFNLLCQTTSIYGTTILTFAARRNISFVSARKIKTINKQDIKQNVHNYF
jgi:hypothetical protein